jgi:hypothetical protein
LHLVFIPLGVGEGYAGFARSRTLCDKTSHLVILRERAESLNAFFLFVVFVTEHDNDTTKALLVSGLPRGDKAPLAMTTTATTYDKNE